MTGYTFVYEVIGTSIIRVKKAFVDKYGDLRISLKDVEMDPAVRQRIKRAEKSIDRQIEKELKR